MSEEFSPKAVADVKDAEFETSNDVEMQIAAANAAFSKEAQAKRIADARSVADKVSNEKDLVPPEFSNALKRSKDAKWYIVHTYSGHEDKVKKNIEKLVENRNMQDLVLEIIVPKETIVEHKGETMKSRERKIFPGYVIVKMIVTTDSWYLVRNTQGVTGFVGQGSEPIPLTEDEVRRMGLEKISIELNIDVGDTVKVITGPFKGFTAMVEQTDAVKQTLKAKVDMFGRLTPVELEYDQVDKL